MEKKPAGSTAIRIEGGANINLKDVRIHGFDVGISATGAAGLRTEGISFSDVRQPFEVTGGSADVRGTRIDNDPKARQGSARMGWSKIKGPSLPAFCPVCKQVFPSKNYSFAGAYFNAWNNQEICPTCGSHEAYLSEGIFDLAGDAIRIVSAADFTHAMLATLQAITADAAQGKISNDEAVGRLSELGPQVASAAKRAIAIGRVAWTSLGTLCGIAALYYAADTDHVAREQLHVAQQQLVSPVALDQKALEFVLDRYLPLHEEQEQSGPKQRGPSPAKGQASGEPTTAKLAAKGQSHKPNALGMPNRHERRKAEAAKKRPPWTR